MLSNGKKKYFRVISFHVSQKNWIIEKLAILFFFGIKMTSKKKGKMVS
jgi:hypothetical protein